ncbi:HAD family hydrolase [Streptomyces sp. NRRL S-87]|uniref:HAD family hydrolase n=1 Tax=Streptomyces sp. NRRL S-87 TaxID=1463920 RepID=UPI0004C25AE4|nr:HAD family hydrolase [Streptomyces sp. NRRL S-87]
MGIRAVLWDIDDTIFDYTGADRAGLARHLAQEGLDGAYGDAARALGVWREVTDRHWDRFAAGLVDFQGQRRDRVRDFTGRPALGDAEADAWFDRYVAHYRAAWALFPDTLPVLDALAASHRHGALSNSSYANQDGKLRDLGVRERFEVLLCAAELGVSKPDAGAFRAGCDALGLAPGEVAYVGDRLDIDAQGACDAGLTGIWLDREGLGTGAVPPGVHRITGLAELPGVLAMDTRFGAGSPFR